MKKTKLISLLLIVALLLCSMSAAAMAEENGLTAESTLPPEIQQVIDENGYLGVSETNHSDLNSITYKVDEDSEVLYIYNAPVKYTDDAGEVQFKSNRAKKTAKKSAKNAEYAYENVNNDIKTYLPNRINDGILIEKDGYKVETFPTTDKNSKVKLVERDGVQYLEYDKAMGKHAHLSYTYAFDGFKENIILDKYMGQNEFSFRINTYGLVPEQETGIFINLLDPETGEIVFTFSQPYVMDARFAEEQRPSLTSFDNYYTIVKDPEAGEEESIYILTEVIDEAFLTDENTQYPVIIDPETKWTYASKDVTVFQNTTSKAIWSTMYMGYMNTTACPNYGNSISMVQLYPEQYLYINPDKIVKAEYVANIWSTPYAFTYRLAIPNSTWTEDTATYSIANNSVSKATYTLAADCWTQKSHDITIYLKDWIRAAVKETAVYSAARGFVLKSANPSTDTSYCSIYSNEAGLSSRPAIKVQYNVDNTLADGIYYITNVNSGKCVDVERAATSEGTLVSQYTYTESAHQMWEVKKYSTLGYTIRPVHALNMYLSLEKKSTNDTTALTDNINNAIITATPYNWYIVKNKDGTYRVIAGNLDGEGLDVRQGSTGNGAAIQAWTNGGNANQKWEFKWVAKGVATLVGNNDADGEDRTSWIEDCSPSVYGLDYFPLDATGKSKATQLSNMQRSNIWTIRGHGLSQFAKLTLTDGTEQYISVDDINALSTNALSNQQLVLLAICKAGEGGANGDNLVNAIQAKGAKAVIGFTTTIYGPQIDTWVESFYKSMYEQSCTIEEAVDYAYDATVRAHPWPLYSNPSGSTENYYIAGSKTATLS